MKHFFTLLLVLAVLAGCSSKNDFNEGKAQLEAMGYTDVKDTGYRMWCCDREDSYSTGFTAKTKTGKLVSGCMCSTLTKGVTIRFK